MIGMSGKAALVTGAASGLGRATARKLGGAGHMTKALYHGSCISIDQGITAG